MAVLAAVGATRAVGRALLGVPRDEADVLFARGGGGGPVSRTRRPDAPRREAEDAGAAMGTAEAAVVEAGAAPFAATPVEHGGVGAGAPLAGVAGKGAAGAAGAATAAGTAVVAVGEGRARAGAGTAAASGPVTAFSRCAPGPVLAEGRRALTARAAWTG